jgi:hypothetical protein
LAAQRAAHAAAVAATRLKAEVRERYVQRLRESAQRAQAVPGLQAGERAALGLPTRATSRARPPAPASAPVASVDTSQRLRHAVSFRDEASPTRRGKPYGTRGCEIWVKFGDPPADPSDCRLLALAFASPHVAHYPGDAAGQTAHYMLRWVNTRGQPGPWSPTVSATVAA